MRNVLGWRTASDSRNFIVHQLKSTRQTKACTGRDCREHIVHCWLSVALSSPASQQPVQVLGLVVPLVVEAVELVAGFEELR